MKARTRTRTRTAVSGRLLWNPPNGYAGPFPYQTQYEEISDYYDKTRRSDGSLPPSDLFIMKENSMPPMASYRKVRVSDDYVFAEGSSLPCGYRGTGKNWMTASDWASLETMTEAQYVAKLLAETNPFRYEVSIPIMISELTEAASLLMFNASSLFSLVGSGYLNWIFGIKPMMQDVKAMVNITRSIESRIREFNSLIKEGGLRRKITLQKNHRSFTSPGGSAWSSYGISMSFSHVNTSASTHVYGSVRWRPKRGKEIDIAQLVAFNEAAKVVLDLQAPDPSTIWEVIPFSWLVDYFVNIGPTLQALERSDLVEPYDICIMRHRKVSTTTYLQKGDTPVSGMIVSVKGQDGQVDQEFKLRKVVSAPGGYTSLLSFGILSETEAVNIIALLWALKRR